MFRAIYVHTKINMIANYIIVEKKTHTISNLVIFPSTLQVVFVWYWLLVNCLAFNFVRFLAEKFFFSRIARLY